MSKEQKEEIEIEVTPGEEETPPVEEKKDDVSDDLTSAQLLNKVEKLVDEKIELARTAQDDEDDEEEEQEEEPKGLGVFPMILIAGVGLVGIASIIMKNRPISNPNDTETQNDG